MVTRNLKRTTQKSAIIPCKIFEKFSSDCDLPSCLNITFGHNFLNQLYKIIFILSHLSCNFEKNISPHQISFRRFQRIMHARFPTFSNRFFEFQHLFFGSQRRTEHIFPSLKIVLFYGILRYFMIF
jgi:hypothetical protein